MKHWLRGFTYRNEMILDGFDQCNTLNQKTLSKCKGGSATVEPVHGSAPVREDCRGTHSHALDEGV